MTTGIKITGMNKMFAFLSSKRKFFNNAVNDSVKQGSELLKNEVKESIKGSRSEPRSVDTGEFLNSIEADSKNNKATVTSNVKQAGFMEFGTSKIQERRHFRNSLARNKKTIEQITRINLSK